MIKIAFIIPRMDEGGMPRVLETLSMGLPKNLYKQYLIVLMNDKPINYDFPGKIIQLLSEGKTKFAKINIFFKRAKLLKDLKKNYNFDIVVSFGVTSNILNVISRNTEKVIMTEHNVKSIEHKSWGLYGRVYNFLIDWYYKKSDCIVTVSSLIATDLIDNYHVPSAIIKVIYNGIDIDQIAKMSIEIPDDIMLNPSRNIDANTINIINVGRLSKQKGQWHLIRMMPYILEKNKNIRLFILGDGEYYNRYCDMITRMDLSKYVFLLGQVKNPFQHVIKARVFAFPSLYEGFSMAFIEAMSLGIPVVATDCKSGPREVIADEKDYSKRLSDVFQKYGVLVEGDSRTYFLDESVPLSNEEIKFADAILSLISNQNLENHYKKMAFDRAKKFSKQCMIKSYNELFLRLLDE